MDTPVKLELDGLSDLDRDDLEALLSGGGAKPGDYEFVERPPADADRAQDFGLTAVVIAVLPVTVAAIGAWLAKKRASRKFKATVRTWDANGQKRYESEISWSSSNSAPPPAEIIDKLSEASKVDPEHIEQEMAKLGK
jgi:hypothetical protein